MIWLNPTVSDDISGEFRLAVDGESSGVVPTDFNVVLPSGIANIREVMMVGGTESLESSWCNRVVTMRMQARSTNGALPGKLKCDLGTRINIILNFKRYPVYSDGGGS
jgi:hypothetical protein